MLLEASSPTIRSAMDATKSTSASATKPGSCLEISVDILATEWESEPSASSDAVAVVVAWCGGEPSVEELGEVAGEEWELK